MSRYLWIVAAVLICCPSTGAPQEFPYRERRETMPAPNGEILSQLNSLTPLLSRDTIYVSSPVGYYPRSCDFIGRMVSDRVLRYFRQYYPEGPVYFAGRTLIGPGVSSYFLRVSDMYGNLNVIDLWVFDHKGGVWVPPVEVARQWGDAGETWELDSWLVDSDGDGYRDLVKRARGTYWEEEKDTLALYFFATGGFVASTDPSQAPSKSNFEFELWGEYKECQSRAGRRLPNQRLHLARTLSGALALDSSTGRGRGRAGETLIR